MDKKKIILNVSTSIFSRIILLVMALVVRRLLIQYIGNDVNGLNSLYTSIIGMLEVAELGIGSAIVFSMYKPILEGNTGKIAGLYSLYQKLYRIIGAVIFSAGLVVMLFLPRLISDYDKVTVNVYLTFFLTLLSVVLSYLYSAKTSLIEAHKDNYITTSILAVSSMVRYILQIAAILIWRSYTAFIICQIIQTLLVWIMTDHAVRRQYGEIIGLGHERRAFYGPNDNRNAGRDGDDSALAGLDEETKSEVSRNVRAMFMHKIGTALVSTIDSLIISGFIGVIVLGKYSNYILIAGVVSGIISLFFSSLTSVIGHLCAAGDKEATKRYFVHFYCLNYVLGVVFFLGYYAVIDNVVTICFGQGLEMSRAIVFIITLNTFTQYMRQAPLLFRNASGTFYNDRWKPVAEGFANLILSLIFVNVFPEEYRVVGVIAATIITTLLICDIVEPYVVYKHVFGQKPWKFYVRSYLYICGFVICMLVMSKLMRPYDSPLTGLLVNGTISVLVSIAALALLTIIDKGFRAEMMLWGSKVLKKIK